MTQVQINRSGPTAAHVGLGLLSMLLACGSMPHGSSRPEPDATLPDAAALPDTSIGTGGQGGMERRPDSGAEGGSLDAAAGTGGTADAAAGDGSDDAPAGKGLYSP